MSFAYVKKKVKSDDWALNKRYFTMNSLKFRLNNYPSSSFLDFFKIRMIHLE